jgi:hypothetical protein
LAHAQLGVKTAEERLKEARDHNTDSQKRANEFTTKGLKAYAPYADALQAATDANKRLKDQTDATNKIQALGVAKNPQVVAAVRQLASAHDAVRRAAEASGKAQKAYQVLVSEGVKGNPRTIAAADGLRSANQGLAQAMHQVVVAQKALSQGSKTSSGANKVANDMKQLDGAEKKLLGSIQGIAKEFRSTMKPATDAVFGGMAKAITSLTPVSAS